MLSEEQYKELIEQECITIIEKLQCDRDIIRVYAKDNNFLYTNIILYIPDLIKSKLFNDVCRETLQLLLKSVSYQYLKDGVVLTAFMPQECSMLFKGTDKDNNQTIVDKIGKLKDEKINVKCKKIQEITKGDKVVVLSANYIAELDHVFEDIKEKGGDPICIILILGLSDNVKLKLNLESNEYREVISINDISK
jgi:hypothetical protein